MTGSAGTASGSAPAFRDPREGRQVVAGLVGTIVLGLVAFTLAGSAVLPLARALVVVLWLAGALAVLAGTRPLFDLTRHFPVVYAATGVLAAVPLALAGDLLWTAAAAAAALVAFAAVAPLWRCPTRARSTPVGHRLRILYANVLTESRAAANLASLVSGIDPDLVLLVEVDDEWLQSLALHELGFDHAVAEPRDDHFGIAAYSRLPLRAARFVPLVTEDMPALSITIDCGAAEVSFLLVHTMPPKGPRRAALRDLQLATAASHVRTAGPASVLVGDLNATPWSAAFRRLLAETGLEDARRGRGLLPTWPARLPWLLRLPIDHVLTRGPITVRDVRAGPAYGSDHRPLLVDLEVCAAGSPPVA